MWTLNSDSTQVETNCKTVNNTWGTMASGLRQPAHIHTCTHMHCTLHTCQQQTYQSHLKAVAISLRIQIHSLEPPTVLGYHSRDQCHPSRPEARQLHAVVTVVAMTSLNSCAVETQLLTAPPVQNFKGVTADCLSQRRVSLMTCLSKEERARRGKLRNLGPSRGHAVSPQMARCTWSLHGGRGSAQRVENMATLGKGLVHLCWQASGLSRRQSRAGTCTYVSATCTMPSVCTCSKLPSSLYSWNSLCCSILP